jgi:cytochrome bd-type quinol oxidase subunit 2
MDFFQNFDRYVAPLNPLGVIVGVILCGVIGGVIIATKENKSVGMWAARGAALFPLCVFVGTHISSVINPKIGGGLPGLFIGALVGCVALVILIMASKK